MEGKGKGFLLLVVVLAVIGTLLCAAVEEGEQAQAAAPQTAGISQAEEEPVDLPLPCVPLVLFGFGGALVWLGERAR